MAEKRSEYTEKQLQVAETTPMQVAAMLKKTRLIAVMIANAYVDGLMACQAVRENESAADAEPTVG